MVAGGDAADRFAEPADQPVIGENEGVVHRLVHAARPRLDLGRQRFLRGGVQGFRLVASGGRVWRETESQ